ncbi:MAG: nitrous oxide-stimulated promoter family protein [Coriobacteriales bacterium]|nr:nitrous oxide-stimulated promoter family protein [Coriobacteriales bacterium]
MNEKFATKMRDPKVRKDTRTLADFTQIWCANHHADRERVPVVSEAAELGVYGTHAPVLCEECAEHLRYAEKRRAYCPMDPKPFCAHCDVHCYKADERAFQQEMMRFSGPRSMTKGHFIDGVKHMIESRKHARAAKR